jgi:hypothetical protein
MAVGFLKYVIVGFALAGVLNSNECKAAYDLKRCKTGDIEDILKCCANRLSTNTKTKKSTDGAVEEVSLRGHHLICMQSFRGLGYSSTFVDCVTRTVAALNNEDSVVRIVVGCDAICKYCPNMVENKCVREIGMNGLDDFFLKCLGLSVGDSLSFNEIRKITEERLSYKAFTTICGNCLWFGICDDCLGRKLK